MRGSVPLSTTTPRRPTFARYNFHQGYQGPPYLSQYVRLCPAPPRFCNLSSFNHHSSVKVHQACDTLRIVFSQPTAKLSHQYSSSSIFLLRYARLVLPPSFSVSLPKKTFHHFGDGGLRRYHLVCAVSAVRTAGYHLSGVGKKNGLQPDRPSGLAPGQTRDMSDSSDDDFGMGDHKL